MENAQPADWLKKESALEIIVEMISFRVSQLDAELKSETPDLVKLNSLEKEIGNLGRERQECNGGEGQMAVITKAYVEYVPILRKLKQV